MSSKLFLTVMLLAASAGANRAFAQANQTLSNLTAPTAINASLLIDTDNTYDLGSTANAFANVYTGNVVARSGYDLNLKTQDVTSGNGPSAIVKGGASTDTTSGVVGGSVILQGGNTGLGSTLGGSIYLQPGVGGDFGTEGFVQMGATNKFNFNTQKGHLEINGPVPAVTSCGTSPSIVGNDSVGRISVGSTTATCTMTFVKAWTHPPMCYIGNETARIALKVVPSSTTLVISSAANFAASTVLDYYCVGYF